MQYLSGIDYVVILLYAGALVGLSLYLKRRASESIEDYFIGGRQLPWWALGVSGMASFLDVTGTMIITSFLFMLGPRGLFIEFRGGAVLVLAFMMLWAGKWHRRSKCLTGAEWMVFRFGDGAGGRFAQLMSVISGVVSTVGMLAYLIKGIGLFLSMFLPFSPFQCALLLVGVATIYTMISGFYGVVYTDMFQSAIILIAVIGVTIMAVAKVATVPDLGAFAAGITGNGQWMSSAPHWNTAMPKGYEVYRHLMLFAMFYLMRNVFFGVASGNDPKYFGARSDRECGQLTFMWTILMTVRWPMMMGFAVLGIFLVHDLFPDQGVIVECVRLLRDAYPAITEAQWGEFISSIANAPGKFSPELIAQIEGLLGADWSKKLLLISFHGTINPERILPAVLLYDIVKGLRGIFLVALIAASMSTFDSTVNMTTGLLTRDIYQKHLRPNAKTKELIYISWFFVALLVGIAFLFAYSVKSINDIWGWIIMGLGGGLMLPNFLRLYWWRFNGSGFAVGTLVGLTAAVLQRFFFPGLDERLQFLIIGVIGLAASILGAYISPPTDAGVLRRFYRATRPFGVWGPLRSSLNDEEDRNMRTEHRRDILASPFALLWQVTMFLIPMQLVIGAWRAAAITAVFWVLGLLGLYFIWYRHMPKDNYFEDEIQV